MNWRYMECPDPGVPGSGPPASYFVTSWTAFTRRARRARPATAAMRVIPARASVAPCEDDVAVAWASADAIRAARPALPVTGGTMYCTGGTTCCTKVGG